MKKKVLIILGSLIIIMCIIGISYAYWRLTLHQLGRNEVTSGCLELILSKEGNAINFEKAYPITDEEGKETPPYSFTVENTCDLFASYIITLEVTKESTLDSSYIASMLNTNAILTLDELETTEVSDDSQYKEAYVLGRGSLGNGDSEDYTLRLWMDEDTPAIAETMNKIFKAKVVITYTKSTYSPVENGITTLHDAILANEYQTTDVQVAIDKINQKQQPDFSKTAPIIEWQEINQTDNRTISFNMPDPADVGSGKDYAVNLTNENVYVGFATSYRFDSETGRYYLENMIYQDPTTIDFSSNSFYLCGASTSVDGRGILRPYSSQNCMTLYQISGYNESKEATITGNYGESYPGVQYSFQRSRIYTQTELESDKSDKGLYATTDDYGTSYYYRGSVKNNYVQFAGYYWRIIRINGDGSIRLLYAGETKDASGSSVQIGFSPFNISSNLPLYVGYMYGNPDGTTLDEVNANTNNSTIKTYLDNWYVENLSNYSNYIVDSGFCNDRTFASYNVGNGITTNNSTTFAPYERYHRTHTPLLICNDQNNNLFTLNNNEIGNKSLTYPIGLITVDELMLAGYSQNYYNPLSYIYSEAGFWTMSPGNFNNNDNMGRMFQQTDGDSSSNWLYNSSGVRPVINLNANVEITGGIGTQNEPFVVKTN